MTEEGGEAPCFAKEIADYMEPRKPIVADLGTFDTEPRGAVWSLPHDGDLDANLVHLASGDAIAAHVNSEVDVFLVVQSGSGTLDVDGATHVLRPGVVALVPAGATRAIAAGEAGMTYLSVHRHRNAMTIATRSRETAHG